MERKKINLIIILLMVLALIGTSSYIFYDKFIVNNETEKDSNQDSNDNDSVELSENASIVKELMQFTGNFTGYRELYANAYKILYQNDKTLLKNISDSDKFMIARPYLISNLIGEDLSIIKEEYLKFSINKIFGENTYNNFNKTQLSYYPCIYEWNEAEKAFIETDACAGGVSLKDLYTKFIRAKKITDNGITTIEIILAIYFVDEEDETGKVYNDVDFKNSIGTNIDTNKLDKYKHTFELDKNDNYIFKSVEKVK